MAFQVGTQIRPELADADYSGFANAATIQAQALQNLGKQIAGGIDKYQKNKQITAAGLAELEGIVAANPNAYAAVQNAGGEAAKSIQALEEGNYKQRDVLTALGAVQAYEGEQQKQQQARMAAIEEQQLMRVQKNQELLDSAIAVNTDTEGKVDYENVEKSYFQLGGMPGPTLNQFLEFGEIKDADKPEKVEIEEQDGRIITRIDGKVTKVEQPFVPKRITIQGKDFIQLAPEYYQPFKQDTDKKTGLQQTFEDLDADLAAGRLSQEDYELAKENATNMYVGRDDTQTGKVGSITQQEIAKGESQPDSIPTITSQEEYDKLPKGSRYIDSEGKSAIKR